MGSYITTGFVFNGTDIEIIKRKLEAMIRCLSDGRETYKLVKASKDEDGDNWIEFKFEELNDIQEGYTFAAEYYFGQIDLTSSFFTSNDISVSVRVEKESDYFGILVDIVEEDLLKSNEVVVLNMADEQMIKAMCELHKVLNYDYAFCDNEAELQYSPKEFRCLDGDVYSIIAVSNNSEFGSMPKVYKSHWNINGLTSREFGN